MAHVERTAWQFTELWELPRPPLCHDRWSRKLPELPELVDDFIVGHDRENVGHIRTKISCLLYTFVYID